jgi:hypothetical protein
MAKSLLLDIDGVIVRDPLLLQHVKNNCVEYVRTKLPECKDPIRTNEHLYLAHGHTARGLQMTFNTDTSDFHEKVYDKRLMDHLTEVIYGTDFQREAEIIHDFTRKGWDVSLFTNAPEQWATPIALAIGDTIGIKCAGPDASTSHFKTDSSFYKGFPGNPHFYVDDSLKNLGAARFLPNWRAIHFTEGPKERRSWCPQIGSIQELALFLRFTR